MTQNPDPTAPDSNILQNNSPPDPSVPAVAWPRLKKTMLISISTLILAIILIIIYTRYWGLGSIIDENIEEQYNNAVREFGMSPVYPPREDFRVGDLFFTAFDIERNAVARIWVGRMENVSAQADSYAATFRVKADNISSSNLATPPDPPNKEAQSNVNAWLESLPIVSLPSITGSSAGAAAFGGQIPYLSGFLSDELTRYVSVEFPNVRAHGFPTGAVTLDLAFLSEFRNKTCRHVYLAHELLESVVSQKEMTCNPEVASKLAEMNRERPLLSCRLELVTRVFLTDKINFRYGSQNANRFGASNEQELLKLITAAPATFQVDAEGKQQVTEGESKVAEFIEKLVAENLSLVSTGAAGQSNNGLNFSKEFNRAVTIGFDSIAPSYIGWEQCSK